MMKKIMPDVPRPAKSTPFKNRNNGMLRMIKQVLDATNAKYFIPFANFNELYHKEHLKFVLDSQSKNRANDVVKVLKKVEQFDHIEFMPESLRPENRYIVVMIPIVKKVEKIF